MPTQNSLRYSTPALQAAAKQVTDDICIETHEKLTGFQLSTRPPLQPLDLRPLKLTPYKRRNTPLRDIVWDKRNAYHPSKWEPTFIQHVGFREYIVVCGPPNAEPFVAPLSVSREEHATRLEHWRRFGGKCHVPDFLLLSQWVHWHLHSNTHLARSWGDTLVFPPAVYDIVLQPVDLIKEHHLLGKDLVTISVKHLNFLLPRYRHQEPATLDLVLCQVWADLGRSYRTTHLSKYSKYLYSIYTKLPKTYARYKLTYHEDAPCYHT